MNSIKLFYLSIFLMMGANAFGDAALFCESERMEQATADQLFQEIDPEQVNSTVCEDGNTLLHVAVMASNDPEVIQELLDMGANAQARNEMGETPIELVSREQQPEIFDILSAQAEDEDVVVQEQTGDVTEEIVVIGHGHPLSAEGLATPVDSLEDAELEAKVAGSIGETIGGEPGVHNSSFGAAVGRPVIHGLSGARVRIMEDRIDTMDVSVTSGDHAVTIDPFIADRIEIYKGSGTLLYGSGAIGGVVDTHTGRIPHDVPESITGKIDLRGTDNGNGKNISFRLDGGPGPWAWHIDGFSRKASDYKIPGFAESALLRSMEEEHHDEDEGEDHDEEEEVFGVMEGSGYDVNGGAVGGSYIGDRGFIGVAVSGMDAEYGIPGHGDAHGHGEEEGGHEEEGEEGNAFIDMRQKRVDVEAGFKDPLRGFKNFNFRLGINNYEHAEVEPWGEVGTAFDNQAWEARAELTHNRVAGWRGAVGVQLSDRSFVVAGEEAITPPVDTQAVGLFWVGERAFKYFDLEAGVRTESVEHDPEEGDSTDFSGLSASLGAIVDITDTWTASTQADYSTRAPVGEELYANGAHLATLSYEVGDSELQEEKALNLSATLKGKGERWTLAGTLYRTDFDDFIFQQATGEEIHELHVRQFVQEDAVFTGLDLEGSFVVADWGSKKLKVKGLFDTVSAEVDVQGNKNLSHIPSDRAGVGLEFASDNLTTSLDFVRVFKQEDVGEFELETEAYNDLRAYLGWEFERSGVVTNLFLRGKNLTNEEQRAHTSIVKDLVPAPGRTFEGGVRIKF